MILKSIEVQGWRCLANPCRLGDFSERLNVIHAPNGAGKSTIFEALRRGLFDGYKVSGEGVDRLRSWGRDLSPSVAIEFAHGDAEYRVVKRFHRDRMAEILRNENGRLVRQAEGEAADIAARAIFGGEKPGRGLSGAEHWGLAQVLWAPQGRLACAELSGGLVGSIRGALDVQAADSASGELETVVRERFLESFTEGGKLRTGAGAPAWVSLENELQDLRSARPALQQNVLDFEERSRRIENLRSHYQRASHDEAAAAAALAKAREEARQYHELLAEKERRASAADRLAAQHGQLDSQLTQIRERRAECVALEKEVERLTAQVPELARHAATCSAAVANAQSALQAARLEQTALDQLRVEIEAAERFLRARADCTRMVEFIAAMDAAAASHFEAKTALAQLVAPDAKALKSIRAASARKFEAEAQLEASLITLQIVPESGGTLFVETAEVMGERILAAGERCEIKGAPEVFVRVPGFGTIRARGPAGSIESLRHEVETTANKLAELTRPFGGTSLSDLEERHDRLAQQAQKVAAAESALAARLAGRTREDWLQECARHQQVVEASLAANPLWLEAAPEVAALTSELQRRHSTALRVRDLEATWQQAQREMGTVQQAIAVGESQMQNVRAQLRSVQRQLVQLTGDGLDDAARAATIQVAALQWDAARGALGVAAEKLTAFPADPSLLLPTLEKQIAGLRDRATKCAQDEMLERGRLQTLAAEAPYRVLAELDEKIARLEPEVASGRTKSDAIKLLYDTIARHRARALASVSGPVESRALAILERIGGRRFNGVHLGAALELGHVSPTTHGERVELENLSGGEQEQVHLAVRLALAQVLAAEERQLVVLDDVLIATDAGRLARILHLLEELSQRLQIIVLTCHPERYCGIEAKLFDLEENKLA